MLDLTPAEKRVIVIVAIVVVSAGFFQMFQPYVEKNKLYDYSQSDSLFSRLSHQPGLLSPEDKNIVPLYQTEITNKKNHAPQALHRH